jgi:hypothetical protein
LHLTLPASRRAAIAGHGEISLAAAAPAARTAHDRYHALTMTRLPAECRRRTMRTILGKVEFLAFEENSRRIRVDFAQKRRLISNDSFSPLC